MLRILVDWLLNAVALVVTAYLLPGLEVDGFGDAMIAALLIGLLNVTLGWLLTLVVFPLTWLLPGLVFLLVNALMIYIVGRMMRGFRVANFVTALLAAVVLTVLHFLFGFGWRV